MYWPILNQSLDAVAEMLTDDVVVIGLADGGAHVGQILDASQPTWFLTYWVRERACCRSNAVCSGSPRTAPRCSASTGPRGAADRVRSPT